jgi:endogenous inhibitor of DNA gyrase (YacG/DUF329 family)
VAVVKATCEVCGKEFIRYRYHPVKHSFCSKKCHGVWNREHERGEGNPNWKGGKKTLVCTRCGKEYLAYTSDREGKFCSIECAHKDESRRVLLKENSLRLAKDETYKKSRRGDGNPMWKGGNTARIKLLRNRLIVWGRQVKERDGHICQICSSDKELHAHHILPVVDFPELAKDLENGTTLCRKCHEKFYPNEGNARVSLQQSSSLPSGGGGGL